MGAPQMTAAQQRAAAIQSNLNIRGAVLNQSVSMLQQVNAVAQDPNSNSVYTFNPINVGLIRGFLVKVAGTLHNADAGVQATRTEFGAANLVSSFTLNDFNNTQRISSTGWHVHLINSAKQPLVFGGAYSPNVPVDYGNNWTVQSAPANIAANSDATVQFYWYVPYAYSKTDLRGAVWAGLVSATAQLQVTLNTNVGVNNTDATLAAYSGSNKVSWKAGVNATVTVWQDYLDQVPRDGRGQPILPPLDMSMMYELRTTNYQNPSVGQDFQMPYTNLRSFLSTSVIYDNGGTLNTGSDINYWALNAANLTSVFKFGPSEAALLARSTFAADPPKGCYYFSHRDAPINTIQFGNVTLVMNPSVVNANAQCLVGYEDFGQLDQVSLATSIGAAP